MDFPFLAESAWLTTLGKGLTSWWGVSSVGAAIVLIAVSFALSFWLAIRPRIAHVNSACKRLEKASDEEGFAREFDDIDEEIRKDPYMGHAWHEFSETLILPGIEDEIEKIWNTEKPTTFFNRNSLLSGLNIRFYNALPNLLTGSGIMFTFIGLVAGIGLASQGLASDKIEQQRQALDWLLGGAALAFSTSIVGLLTSIIFSWFEKHKIHQFDKYCARWNRSLDERLERVTPEHLHRESLQNVRQQTRVLEGFTENLAFQIAKAVDEKVTQPMEPMMERVAQAVEGLRQDRDSSNEAVLQRMVEEFKESVTGAAGTELQQLGGTLEQLNDSLGEQIQKAEQRHQENEEASQKAMQEMQQVFNDGVTQLQQTMEGFNQTLESVKQLNADSSAMADKLQQMLEGVNESQQALAETTQPLQDTARQFGETSQALQEVGNQIDSGASAMAQAVEEIGQLQEQIRNSWQAYQERFEQVDQSLARTFQEIDEGLSRYTQSVQEFIQGIDRHTGEIVSQLSGAVSELQESVEELSEANSKAG